MPLVKVTDLTYHRSASGMTFGYGKFVVESAGQDQALSTIDFVPHPDRLYQQISDLLFGGDKGAPGALVTTAQRMAEEENEQQARRRFRRRFTRRRPTDLPDERPGSGPVPSQLDAILADRDTLLADWDDRDGDERGWDRPSGYPSGPAGAGRPVRVRAAVVRPAAVVRAAAVVRGAGLGRGAGPAPVRPDRAAAADPPAAPRRQLGPPSRWSGRRRRCRRSAGPRTCRRRGPTPPTTERPHPGQEVGRPGPYRLRRDAHRPAHALDRLGRHRHAGRAGRRGRCRRARRGRADRPRHHGRLGAGGRRAAGRADAGARAGAVLPVEPARRQPVRPSCTCSATWSTRRIPSWPRRWTGCVPAGWTGPGG